MNRRSIYWISQIGGWLFFVILNSVYYIIGDKFDANTALNLFLSFFFGVIYTHLYREVIIRFNWLKLDKGLLVPLILLASLLISVVFWISNLGVQYLVDSEKVYISRENLVPLTFNILNIAFLVVVWSLIYFLVHFVENYRKAEIENLKWEASINEIELNKLKSQLNPHFIFNSMNSIRALVDEEPAKAKDSITRLSNILRNTLLMGKKKVISFDEEYKIVKDYLDLEATRFEERLKVTYDIQPGSEKFDVPPLMIQTLIENGIKHGISKLTEGGEICLATSIRADGRLEIRISNTGHFNGVVSETGFGIKSTRERLRLLYGDKGEFQMSNGAGDKVVTTVIIPAVKII